MGTDNVYADLGYVDADEMLIKAQLVAEIAEIIKRKGITQTEAAALLKMPQPKLSNPAKRAVLRFFRAPSDGLPHEARA